MISIHHTIRNAFAGLALAVASVGGAQAATVDVRVGNTVYTLESRIGSFDTLKATLVDQPWWEDQQLAVDLAQGLGFRSALAAPSDNRGPYFAFDFLPDVDPLLGSPLQIVGFVDIGFEFFLNPADPRTDLETAYAVATSVAPIPLPPAAALLLGGLGALGLVKRRRA